MQTAGKKKVFEFCICGFEGTVYHCIYSSLAQSVEHAAVNRSVVGSSPTGGALNSVNIIVYGVFLYMYFYIGEGRQ